MVLVFADDVEPDGLVVESFSAVAGICVDVFGGWPKGLDLRNPLLDVLASCW